MPVPVDTHTGPRQLAAVGNVAKSSPIGRRCFSTRSLRAVPPGVSRRQLGLGVFCKALVKEKSIQVKMPAEEQVVEEATKGISVPLGETVLLQGKCTVRSALTAGLWLYCRRLRPQCAPLRHQ